MCWDVGEVGCVEKCGGGMRKSVGVWVSVLGCEER